jgi:biotin carboxyl carrier protein
MTSIIEVEPGVYSILVDGASYEARLSGDEIAVNGYRIARRQKRASGPAGAHGKASIVAPMPGKVVRLLVAPEQEVTAGQGIVVVEAMKMQNELKSPRDGRVTALNVKENDSVNAGAILAVIEG